MEFKVLKNQFAFMKNTLAYSERVLFCNKRFNALLFVEIKEIANTFEISYSCTTRLLISEEVNEIDILFLLFFNIFGYAG